MTSGDCACPSRYYRYKRTKTAKNKLSKTSDNKVIGQKPPKKTSIPSVYSHIFGMTLMYLSQILQFCSGINYSAFF